MSDDDLEAQIAEAKRGDPVVAYSLLRLIAGGIEAGAPGGTARVTVNLPAALWAYLCDCLSHMQLPGPRHPLTAAEQSKLAALSPAELMQKALIEPRIPSMDRAFNLIGRQGRWSRSKADLRLRWTVYALEVFERVGSPTAPRSEGEAIGEVAEKFEVSADTVRRHWRKLKRTL